MSDDDVDVIDSEMNADASKAYRSHQIWKTVRYVVGSLSLLVLVALYADCAGGLDLARIIHGS